MTDRRRGVLLWAWVISALLLSPAPALAKSKSPGSDLEGTWYLLIHYTDELTTHHKSTRWLDRVWTFSMQGSRLVWSDYPIVVVEDPSGRFESLGTNVASRVIGPWEPNERQMSEIMEGPRVNSRGSRTKSLKGSDGKGWRSFGRQHMNSASSFGYMQTWVIDRSEEVPVFEILESIGNDLTENEEGKTVYRETKWLRKGKEITGIYGRDGTQRGTFRMFRTPALRPLLSAGKKSPNERQQDEASKTGKIPTLPF